MSLSKRFTDPELAIFLRGCRTGEEHWVDHPDYPGLTVSNLGGVRRDGKLLKGHQNSKGYRFIMVQGKRRPVHQLVLETFIGPRPTGLQTCHWNGKPHDNVLMNLRWDTHLANMADRKRHAAERRALALANRRPTTLERLRAKRVDGIRPKRWAEIHRLLQQELELAASAK